MIDYRLLNVRLLQEIGADVKLTPAELHSLGRMARREKLQLDQIARKQDRIRTNVLRFTKRIEAHKLNRGDR